MEDEKPYGHPNEVTLNEHLAAENEHDLDRIAATYARNPEIVINGQKIKGIEKITHFHLTFGFSGSGSFSDVHVREVQRHHSNSAIIIEQVLSGVHTGVWQGLEPTGRRFEVAVCTVYRFDFSGLLAREDVFFDLQRLRHQLEMNLNSRA